MSTLAQFQSTVLLVDDDPAIALMLRRAFKRIHEPVHEHVCSDGLDALHFLIGCEEHLPEVALLDILMPRMDGLTLLKHIREVERFRKLPVYMLTGDPATELREFAESLDIAGDLLKPGEWSGFEKIAQTLARQCHENRRAS